MNLSQAETKAEGVFCSPKPYTNNPDCNRSYWVVPGKLLAGCYPGAADPAQVHHKLKELLDHGIRWVISLMEPTETNWNGKAFVSYEDKMKSIADDLGVEVFFNRMSIKDTYIPSRQDRISGGTWPRVS